MRSLQNLHSNDFGSHCPHCSPGKGEIQVLGRDGESSVMEVAGLVQEDASFLISFLLMLSRGQASTEDNSPPGVRDEICTIACRSKGYVIL